MTSSRRLDTSYGKGFGSRGDQVLEKLTPLMQQFWEIKNQHLDKVLFFRMGDFFEMFGPDAELAAPILNIALTQRNKKSGDNTKMCGMPHHSIAAPIAKLLQAGHKVAICDQVEDPKLAKGLVKRQVTRILSPGMVYDPDTLDQLSANYLCAYDDETVAFLETSTGEAFYYRVAPGARRERILTLLAPTEMVLAPDQKRTWLETHPQNATHISIFDGSSEKSTGPESAQRLLAYALMMQGQELLQTLTPFEERRLQAQMELSQAVVRHLELFETYKGDKKGSLYFAINRTQTSAGARLLKDWIRFPLTDVQQIESRLSEVEAWVKKPEALKTLRSILSQMGDVERRLGKVSHPGCNARDLLALAQSLDVGLQSQNFFDPEFVEESLTEMAQKLSEKILRTIVDEPGVSVREGGMIRPGVSPLLDEYMTLTQDAQDLLLALEAREKQATGIGSLKVRYNNVFGFYIEITKTHAEKVPKHYMRKQTLANAERFTTPELQELEDKVLSAKAKRADLEFAIFSDLKTEILAATRDLLYLSRKWSEMDVYSSLAWLALENQYRRPQFSKDQSLNIKGSRHPVVEQEMTVQFVPNDIVLKKSECLLLTGPNMAGKSTLMRQVALAAILAQMGSFVPAQSAVLPVFDRVFTRIGASDHLAEGLSTFMVEMKETAEMLKEATENSLVILDEVGRGTSTYDGMSLAQAILEFLLEKKRALTFFATHYHEITKLELRYSQVHNAHMSIYENKGQISFLHTLKPGPANKSYGIQVAQLAGLPASVTQRAKKLLEGLEGLNGGGSLQLNLLDAQQHAFQESASEGLAPVSPEIEQLIEKIRSLSLQKTTPLDALNLLAQWQNELS